MKNAPPAGITSGAESTWRAMGSAYVRFNKNTRRIGRVSGLFEMAIARTIPVHLYRSSFGFDWVELWGRKDAVQDYGRITTHWGAGSGG